MSRFEQDQATEISGRRFAWREHGSGPKLLLVQGYCGSAGDWPPDLLEELGRSFSLILPDNRGLGDSDLGDPAGVTIDSMADDLVALLDHLEIESLPVVGFSMGGFIAQALGRRAGDRVASLALISTDAGGPQAVRADPDVWARLVDHSGTPRERASRTISVIFPPAVAPDIDRDFGEIVAQAQAGFDLVALAAEESAMDGWWAVTQAVGTPADSSALIIAGAEDVVIPSANARLIAERFESARVECLAGAGHAVHAQQPAHVADLIRSQVRAAVRPN